ncbi:hypothetical protein HNY73_021716 [Argiope bruennichi]|uniref:Uncharacterized protein n=1 Tax=Argiope bruennichi TaxID=94029 RepID=A0A8T0DYE2_ARGBR|nr:hypothetical protein HNY73_021716 [Argiope bruennichi]
MTTSLPGEIGNHQSHNQVRKVVRLRDGKYQESPKGNSIQPGPHQQQAATTVTCFKCGQRFCSSFPLLDMVTTQLVQAMASYKHKIHRCSRLSWPNPQLQGQQQTNAPEVRGSPFTGPPTSGPSQGQTGAPSPFQGGPPTSQAFQGQMQYPAGYSPGPATGPVPSGPGPANPYSRGSTTSYARPTLNYQAGY